MGVAPKVIDLATVARPRTVIINYLNTCSAVLLKSR